MLSVVVYGRNDSHGYNLHKRAAISLNCVAEMLTHPDDEILFVDYNTPDDYPTFIEAIADTLTDRARALLRVFRVRPSVHAARARSGRFQTMESLARNVAVRRSNPANRWVLSTNTDVVLVPRDIGRSLSDIADGLPDGFYHLPRFEVPETLWESLDRRNPQAVMERFRHWGRALHLNEVVHTDALARFDGVGDFQLMPRADLFAIDGLNEAMESPWLVDLNLCRRMQLRLGPVRGLHGHLFIYHCDHTRQATAIHRADTVMNDRHRFLDTVDAPELPEQRDRWGLAGVAVEEFRAAEPPAAAYIRALETVLPGLDRPFLEAWNDPGAYHDLHHDERHVLPYVADHLLTLPPDATVLYAGGGRRLFRLFRAVWRGTNRGGRLLVPPGLFPDDLGDGVEEAAFADAFAAADMMVAEFGIDSDDTDGGGPDRPDSGAPFTRLGTEDRDRLYTVTRWFLDFVEAERAGMAQGAPGRKIVTVNTVNTYFGALVRDHIEFTWTAYSCRVRYGRVRRDWPAAGGERSVPELHEALTRSLGRKLPIDPWEVTTARADLRFLLARAGDEPPDPKRCSQTLLALLAWPGLQDLEGVAADAARALAGRIAAGRPSAALRPLLPEQCSRAPQDGHPFCKLAASEDWERKDWFAWAHRYTMDGLVYRTSTYNAFKRSRGVWERAQILHALDRLGLMDGTRRFAVLNRSVDGLPLFLSSYAARVDLFDAAPDAGRGGSPPEHWLAKHRLFRRAVLGLHTGGLDTAPIQGRSGRWDAIVLPQNTLFAWGRPYAARLLGWIDRHLEEDGVLAFSGEVALRPTVGRRNDQWLEWDGALSLERLFAEHTGFTMLGSFDAALGDATLDRTAKEDGSDTLRPHFLRIADGIPHLCGVWVCRKSGPGGPGGWDRAMAELPGLGIGDPARTVGKYA